MLACQMVVTHVAAMGASRRALHVEQTPGGRQAYLSLARKLMTLYASQMDALNRHRGKATVQRVVVERVEEVPVDDGRHQMAATLIHGVPRRISPGITVGAAMDRVLSPAFLERRWKKGQSGNPLGHPAEYGDVVRLARSVSIRAIERLTELMESEDERVATVACNAVLDRAFGRPQVHQVEPDKLAQRIRDMTLEQRQEYVRSLIERARERLAEDDRRRAEEAQVIDREYDEVKTRS